MLHEKVKVPFFAVLLMAALLGAIIGLYFVPAAAPPVGNDRIVEKPVLFDPPLKKGVENLNWEH
jgi:hypothetical protein